jgi:hypothetical protein
VNVGAAYIFQKDQGGINNWGQVRKPVATDGASGDFFMPWLSQVTPLL